MELITEPIQRKRKRFNKNKKKAWRKRINISDVEEHLEEKRREERLGGTLEDRSFNELFSLDLGAEKKKVRKRKEKVAQFICKEGFKPLYVKNKEKPIKCHKFINGLPGAPAISVKKGTMKQRENKIIKTARKVSRGTPKACLQRMVIQKQRKMDLAKKKKVYEVNFQEDLWNKNKDELGTFNDVSKSFLGESITFYEEQTRQNKVRTPGIRFEKPSLLPAIIVPKAGASYNPSFDAHQKLLAEALIVENKKQKKEQKALRLIEKYVPSSKDGITEMERLVEMSEGLPSNDQDDFGMYGIKEENDVEEDQTYTGHKMVEKKSAQTRRKAKTLKVKEQKRLHKKKLNQRESNIYKLKSYAKDIKLIEKQTELLQKKRKKKRHEDKFKTKRLSKHKIEDDDVFVPLGNEIGGSLCLVQPVGNPLDFIYKSYQRRNMVVKRVPAKMSKRKQKMITKSTCKGELNILNDDDE